MRSRTATAALCLLALALTGACGSSGDPAPEDSRTSASPTFDAAARQACVEAWADVFEQRVDDVDKVDVEDDQPSACKDLPDRPTSMFADGLKLKLDRGREELADCMDDPACAETWGS